MGQKVHPLGFRVGITKKHQNQWFARFNKNKYSQTVLEDHMLRQTLTSLFPELINPVLKKVNQTKRDEKSSAGRAIGPLITQIQIERGLIPYSIGIKIHAENCDLIKTSIENLKINKGLAAKLQKTRRYLQTLQTKLNDSTFAPNLAETQTQQNVVTEKNPNKKGSSLKKKQISTTIHDQRSWRKGPYSGPAKGRSFPGGKGRRRVRLTKQQLRRKRLILKRLRKRQNIRRRYKQLVYKGLFLAKKGNKVVRKFVRITENNKQFIGRLSAKTKGSTFKKANGSRQANFDKKSVILGLPAKVPTGKSSVKKGSSVLAPKKTTRSNARPALRAGIEKKKYTGLSAFKQRIKKKFVKSYITRMNKKFLQVLKSNENSILNNTKQNKTLKTGNKKWNKNSINSTKYRLKSIVQLNSLISVLEQKCLNKMESLRKDFILFGKISKTQKERYFNILNFLKELKEYVSKLKRNQKLQNEWQSQHSFALDSRKKISKFSKGLPSKKNLDKTAIQLLTKKLNNIKNEYRKNQFIEYLKEVVRQHRSKNIYHYLSTIADARKDLRKLKLFTKKHASFLFGVTLGKDSPYGNNNHEAGPNEQKIEERVRLVLENSNKKQEFEKTLQDVFIEQIEKQRKMYKDNAQLTPKIVVKFYSVKKQKVNAKASVVADSVVDALEQRKSFRKVIKEKKEQLMNTPGIKGVKIQVSGRLNGAEIARSEWVRAGRVPLQTLRANLDYSNKTANTLYGIIGIKVWIFKGYTKLL